MLSYYVNIDTQQDIAVAEMVSPLFRPILLQCAVVCVQAAQEAIEVIHRERSTEIGAVGSVDAWWYNVLFLYSSATCLVAARLTATVQIQIQEESIEGSWRKCMEILGEYSTFNTSIQKVIATLNILYEAVPRQYSRMRLRPNDVDRPSCIPLGSEQPRGPLSEPIFQELVPAYSWLSDQFLFDVPSDFDFDFNWDTTYDWQA